MSVDDRFQRVFTEISQMRQKLRDDDNGGTGGGMSDDWKQSVDSQLAQLHGDLRNLLLGLIGGFLFLLAGGLAAYLLLDGKFDQVDAKFEKVDARLTAVERKVDVIDTKLDILIERSGGAQPRKAAE